MEVKTECPNKDILLKVFFFVKTLELFAAMYFNSVGVSQAAASWKKKESHSDTELKF